MRRADLWAILPELWPHDPWPILQAAVRKEARKVVVLDDDPTGTQTVHDVPVLTVWDTETLAEELKDASPSFYVLTNSRSLPVAWAERLNLEIARHLAEARDWAGRDFVVVSRSDSTLRGHFPTEPEALMRGLGETFDALLLIPCFHEGGRYTVNDMHYVEEAGWLTPVAATEYACDSVFGFASSDLRAWVEEKTEGGTPADAVASVSLGDIRCGGPERVAERLLSLHDRRYCVVNAVSRRDLEVFTVGLLAAESKGKKFLYRTAASFIPVRVGLGARSLLAPDELALDGAGGLVVVGSHVPKSTRQLEYLLAHQRLESLEIAVSPLLNERTWQQEVDRVAAAAEKALAGGKTVLVSTQRELFTSDQAGRGLSDLEIGQRVSASLVRMVQGITTRPRFLVVKGGITSSDVATHGLGVRRAVVRGQLLPGVPVWELGEESRFPGLVYVVFPGNVGDDGALAEAVQKLSGGA